MFIVACQHRQLLRDAFLTDDIIGAAQWIWLKTESVNPSNAQIIFA